MRRYAPIAAVLIGLFAGGCSASQEATPTKTRKPAQKSAQKPVLELPAHAAVLVPETSGTADQDLKEFKPGKGAYTVYAHCTGKGKVTIVDKNDSKESREDRESRESRESKNSSTISIPCDGVVSVGRVYVDANVEVESERLSTHVTGTAAWTIAVVAGEHEV